MKMKGLYKNEKNDTFFAKESEGKMDILTKKEKRKENSMTKRIWKFFYKNRNQYRASIKNVSVFKS